MITKTVENVFRFAASGLNTTVDQVVELDTFIDNTTVLSKDGHLCTFVDVRGAMVEDNNYGSYAKKMDQFSTSISSFFKEDFHRMHVVYRRDDEGSKEEVERSLRLCREKAKSLKIDGSEELFDDISDNLSKSITTESVYIALWTTSGAINKREREEDQKLVSEANKELPLGVHAQALTTTNDALITIHQAYVKKVVDSLRKVGVAAFKLDRDGGMLAMASLFNPHLPNGYQFMFPDREYYARPPVLSEPEDLSSFMPESLGEQILTDNLIGLDLDDDIVRVNDRLFTTFEVKTPPRGLVLFNEFADGIDVDVPFQMSFWIDSGVSSAFFWKKIFAAFPFPNKNKRIKKSIDAVNLLKEIKIPDVEYKISITTWSSDYPELMKRKSYLKGEVSSWGNSGVRNYRGCPLDAVVSSTGGMNSRTFGSTVYAPIVGVSPQLPFNRRFRLWDSGFINFTTRGNTLYPFSPKSSMQDYWNIGLCATMGSGKSVLLQQIALSVLFGNIGSEEMPMIGYLDNGFSAKNMIEMLKEMSPTEFKHKYLHITMMNTPEYAFNILTTRIGLRKPDVTHLAQIISLLVALCTPTGANPSNDLYPLIQALVKDTFLDVSDDRNAKMYAPNRDTKVDSIVSSLREEFKQSSYYEIEDELFKQGRLVDCQYVHRYAVPTLRDVIKQLNKSQTVQDSYANVTIDGQQPICEYVRRMLTAAIERYPILATETKIDVDMARFIVIDLNAVAKGGTPELDKEAEVFYTIARYIVSRPMFIDKSTLDVVPDLYRAYYESEIPKITSIPKMLCYDEFHRIKSEGLLTQIETEEREGRKWSLLTVLASQLLREFERFKDLLSTVFILSKSVAKPNEMKETFALNTTSFRYLMDECNGPSSDGVNFICNIKTKMGSFSLPLNSKLSPSLYWMTSSNDGDKSVSSVLISKIGVGRTIDILKKAYPFGVSKTLEYLAKNHGNANVRANPVEYVVNELLKNV
ncbi:hypothetical protein [Photobacterium damselae]|uniref:hypothetical protein n=1 Tax=Photobacterium damselae TaxID=38293 RepID=UPI0040697DE5